MKRALPWILLGLSVAGNAFFALGYLYGGQLLHRLQTTPAARFERLAKRLHLNPEQATRLRQERRTLMNLVRRERSAQRRWDRHFWAEFRQTKVDSATIDRLLVERGERELAFRKSVVARIRGFLDGLSPDQRQRLLDLLRRRDLFVFLHSQAQRPGPSH